MRAFRYISLLVPALLALCSCQQQNIILPVEFSVTLDQDNVYRVGEKIRFKLSGDADYMVFYSGEEGHEYKYCNRTSIPVEDINSVELNLEMERLWGPKNSIEIYFAPQFDGLKGNDGEADRAKMRKLVAEGLPGFTKIDYEEADHGIWAKHTYQIDTLVERFCLAFHWVPYTIGFTQCQATYHVRGNIQMKYGEKGSITTDLSDVSFQVLVMNEEDPPYMVGHRGDSTNIGTIHFDQSQYAINFEGTSQTYLNYEIEDWCISEAGPLNNIHRDEGVQIKSMMNPLFEYDHTYTQPGTYKATFVGVNDNYQGHMTGVKEITIVIADNPINTK